MKSSISPYSRINLIVKLWRHLSVRRHRQFIFLLGLMLVSALFEVISLGAVLPFIGVVVAPEQIFDIPIVMNLAQYFGIMSANELIFPITIVFIVAAIIANGIRVFLLWVNTRLSYASGADLSLDVYFRTLHQPYQVHTSRNSSEVISSITNKVNGVTFGILLSLLTLISSTVLLAAIISTLFVIDPIVASFTAIGFGVSYFLISIFSRKQLYRNSIRIAHEQTQVIKALQEGLGGIRDVLLHDTQQVYCDVYRNADQPLRKAHGNNMFISQYPRYIMEAMGMVLIAVLAYFLSRQEGGVISALPILGALALGAQRLLPALNQIYSSWANIVGTHAALVDTIALLEQPIPINLKTSNKFYPFKKSIEFNNVSFRYSLDEPWVLKNINLRIPKGVSIGFVGQTGSGKSTILDLLMGLLKPDEGDISVDSNLLELGVVSIAHVPQSIFLSDATLAENIAFGVSYEDINMSRMKMAAQQAQIADFIESRANGYLALVGEQGIQLSGGQRQRIGIARALYRSADILVLDEATSALDNSTERLVMDAITHLNSNLTIVIIAHRLSTVRECDVIVELGNGGIIAKGTYNELLETSKSFKKMALKS